ncbi:MAG: PilZ domain-containing protein [Proteobacteria bacterium]|nr:PilZ domain-containing protein [Pseudomonadota bacterium]MBU1742973.1 PilZ domain-containing protein [Pseudomonadota bacterium]
MAEHNPPDGPDDQNLRQDARVQILFPVKFKIWSRSDLPTLTKRHRGLSAEAMSQLGDVSGDLMAETEIEDFLRPLLPILSQLERKLNFIIQLLTEREEVDQFPAEGEIIDLSGSGARLITDVDVPADGLLEMAIRPPGLQTGIPLVGAVQRVRPSGQAPYRREVALLYVIIQEMDRERIIRYVFQAQRQQLQSRTYRQEPGSVAVGDRRDDRSE